VKTLPLGHLIVISLLVAFVAAVSALSGKDIYVSTIDIVIVKENEVDLSYLRETTPDSAGTAPFLRDSPEGSIELVGRCRAF